MNRDAIVLLFIYFKKPLLYGYLDTLLALKDVVIQTLLKNTMFEVLLMNIQTVR